MRQGDLKVARAVAERLFVLTEVFYAEPFLDMHNRMKEALVLLGKLERSYVRPPLLPIDASERERIRDALVRARLLADERVTAREIV